MITDLIIFDLQKAQNFFKLTLICQCSEKFLRENIINDHLTNKRTIDSFLISLR